jgi:hypothetical protein
VKIEGEANKQSGRMEPNHEVEEPSSQPVIANAVSVNEDNNVETVNSVNPLIQGIPQNTAEIERNLTNQISNLSSRVKFAIPILSLLILKLVFDNITVVVISCAILYGFERIKANLQTQLALKERSDSKALFIIIASCVGTLLVFVFALPYLNYRQQLQARLSISTDIWKHSIESNLFQLIWDCFLTDLFVQIFFTMVKAVLSLFFDQSHNVLDLLKKIPFSGRSIYGIICSLLCLLNNVFMNRIISAAFLFDESNSVPSYHSHPQWRQDRRGKSTRS